MDKNDPLTSADCACEIGQPTKSLQSREQEFKPESRGNKIQLADKVAKSYLFPVYSSASILIKFLLLNYFYFFPFFKRTIGHIHHCCVCGHENAPYTCSLCKSQALRIKVKRKCYIIV